MKQGKILVTGSLAFDHIMDFPGRFADHILPNKIHVLNLSFLVETLKKQWGGTAGNIAYNLALLGEKPLILSAAGRDFGAYARHLRSFKVDLSQVSISKNKLTPTFFVMTDKDDNQIAGFYLGAMAEAPKLSLRKLTKKPSWAVVSPNEPRAMVKYCRECRDFGIKYIFDPGQQIPRLGRSDIIKCIEDAEVLIGNDYEIELLKKKTGLSNGDLLERVRQAVVITKGSRGSIIKTKIKSLKIPAVKPKRNLDPTGAGDAYRAGLIKGIIHNCDWATTGRLAALAAVYAVETYGTQTHHYSLLQFKKKYEKNFGKFPLTAYN